MKDTRVTFETAKLAKEKGFDIKTKYSWYVPDNSKPIIEKHKPDGLYYLSCPTQSLLAKWLREEYNLHINICSLSMNCFSFMLEKLNDTGTTLCGGHLGKINYKTYEEANEMGLQEALKLI